MFPHIIQKLKNITSGSLILSLLSTLIPVSLLVGSVASSVETASAYTLTMNPYGADTGTGKFIMIIDTTKA